MKSAFPVTVSEFVSPDCEFTVELKVTVVAVIAVFVPSVIASPYDCAAVVETDPPLIAVPPPASVVKLVSAVLLPIAPPSVVDPLPELSVNA